MDEPAHSVLHFCGYTLDPIEGQAPRRWPNSAVSINAELSVQPIDPGLPIARKLQQELLAVAALGEVLHVT